VKRLAIHVEDHPIEYNPFEGTIPEGEYGGGTVMVWDHGTYTAAGDEADPEAALREGFREGDLKFVLRGKRLTGSWVLVRTKGWGDRSRQGQWLLIKHRDDAADPDADPVAEHLTSARSGRTMEEIAEGKPAKRPRKRRG
jgi:bifunctional non-homologous end joining protein LigD